MALHGPFAYQGAVVGGAVAADGDFALLAVVEEAPAVEQFAVAVERMQLRRASSSTLSGWPWRAR